MKLFTAGRAAGIAALAAGVALSLAFTLAGALRRRAARGSHQQFTAEQLFEPATPTSIGLVAEGRRLFLDSCAHCHGADATGDEGPDLHDLQVSDRYIRNTITRGIPHEMPSFAKKHGAAELAALTAFVRSLKSSGD
jgi:mono/diheme cytochrome c family protein